MRLSGRRAAVTSLPPFGACLLVAVTAAAPIAGQASALVIEARGGLSQPLGSFASGSRPGEGAAAAPSFGVDFALPGGRRLAPYLGFSQHRFGCEDAGCSEGGQYVATGFHGGLRLVPFLGPRVLPWVRMGVVTTQVETGALGGADAGVSKLGVGGEVGVGVHIGSGSPIALNPGVRLVAVNSRLPGGSVLRMRYAVADLGLVLGF